MKAIQNKSKRITDKEKKINMLLEDYLYQAYVIDEKTIEQIAKDSNSSTTSIKSWLNKAGIYSRKLQL